MENWYVVQTQVKKEQEVKYWLQRKNYEVFLPEYEKQKKKLKMILPLFPGYLFTKFDREERQWQEIHRMIGVSKLLGYEAATNTIACVKRGVVEGLQSFCDEITGFVDFNRAYPCVVEQFQQGDVVQIVDGIFKNQQATYWNSSGKGHMLILSLLNRPVRVILRNEEITRGLPTSL